MADDFTEEMVKKYQDLLRASAGFDSIDIDGQRVRYADVLAGYRYWKKQKDLQDGNTARQVQVDLRDV